MPWFNVDDGFFSHPKVSELNMSARGLWVTAGSYCARYLTDGRITPKQVRQLGGTAAQINKLIAAGLWNEDTDPDGSKVYVFHDYLDANRSKIQVEEQREKERKKKQDQRAGKTSTSSNQKLSLGDSPIFPQGRPATQSNPLQSPREGNRVQGDQPASPFPVSETPPSDFDPKKCAQHQGVEYPPPCQGCKRAREQAEAEQAAHARADAQQRQETEAARRRDKSDCNLCDQNGRRPNFNHRTGVETEVVCFHHADDHQAVEEVHRIREQRNAA